MGKVIPRSIRREPLKSTDVKYWNNCQDPVSVVYDIVKEETLLASN